MGVADDTLLLPACTVDLKRRRAVFRDREEKLTARDVEVLRYLATHEGEAVSREDLERDVWQMAASVQSDAVPVAIRRIRQRIERNPKDPEALLTDYGHGWRLHRVSRPIVQQRGPRLYGRDAWIASLVPGSRLRTLVGPGGVGKSTLARAISPPGSVWIDLSQATDPASCLDALGQALPGTNGADPAAVSLRLRDVPSTVIDNAEQVLDVVRGWVVAWQVPVCVTSQVRLGVPGEQVVAVETLASTDAIALFLERYQEAGGRGTLDVDQVGALVDALDRLPLAIELVAPRARVIPVDQLLERLRAGLGAIPVGEGRDPRHRTMRGCLAWGIEGLSSEQLGVLQAAALFAGSFALDDLEAVVGEDALEALESLLDRSLLQPVEGAFRVRMLVRSYVSERPAPPGFVERYVQRVLDRLHAVGGPDADGPERDQLVPELRRVCELGPPAGQDLAARALGRSLRQTANQVVAHEVFESAIRRLEHPSFDVQILRIVLRSGVDLAGALALLEALQPADASERLQWWVRRQFLARKGACAAVDPRQLQELVAAVVDPEPAALAALAMCQLEHGDHDGAAYHASRAVEAARTWSKRELSAVLVHRDFVLAALKRDEGREQVLREALRLAIDSGYRTNIAFVRHNLAVVLAGRDRNLTDQAMHEAEAAFADIGDVAMVAMSRSNRAANLWFLERPQEAYALLERAPLEHMYPRHRPYHRALQAMIRYDVGRLERTVALEALVPLLQHSLVEWAVMGTLLTALLGEPLPVSLATLLAPLGERPYDPTIEGCLARLAAR